MPHSPFLTALFSWNATTAEHAAAWAGTVGQALINAPDDQRNTAYVESISATGRQTAFEEVAAVLEYSPVFTLLHDDQEAYLDQLRSWLLWTMSRAIVEGLAQATSPALLRSHLDALIEINLRLHMLAAAHGLRVDVVELPELSFDTHHRFERNLRPLLPRISAEPLHTASSTDLLRLTNVNLHTPEHAEEYLLRCRVFQVWWSMAWTGNTTMSVTTA